ncbi:hypothetical protein ElyMa_001257000 [Elysia marginata]|uniref:Uncharacterized protein n=1 Tax=Elysia marginata TaxID=1093978 RepID=A0AAV4IDN0_9GAST|nr:hypothetical protein ElyMa_001257000 [Elysia marginata]
MDDRDISVQSPPPRPVFSSRARPSGSIIFGTRPPRLRLSDGCPLYSLQPALSHTHTPRFHFRDVQTRFFTVTHLIDDIQDRRIMMDSHWNSCPYPGLGETFHRTGLMLVLHGTLNVVGYHY